MPMAGALLRGTAFAGDRGASKVEVSVDDGASWQPARIDYSGSRLTWRLWSYQWNPSRPGEHRLVVRAFDGTGTTQIEENKSSGPEGATGLHRVTARVA